MRENKLKERLRAGGSAIGTFAKFSDPASVEILALAGFDFFVLDNEHVMFNRETMLHILRAAEASGISPVLRVRKNADVELLQVLDAGAPCVLVPQVNSAAEARACASYVKYAPEGNRGFAPTHRAAAYGTLDPAEYAAQANAYTFLGCYCETRQAVEEIGAIARVPGIDLIFLGPMDLSQSYGVTGKPKSPAVTEAIAAVEEACFAAGRALGTIAANAQEAARLLARGYRFVTISSDQGLLLASGRAQLQALKGLIAEGGNGR